jgi:hypothetical protein
LTAVLGVGACGGGSGPVSSDPTAARPASTTSTTLPRRTTTTTVPLYSFDNSVPPPTLVNTGSDYKKILQSLLDYGNWMAAHDPDPALIKNITAPGSPIEAAYRHDAGILHRLNKRAYEIRTEPNEITVRSAKPDLFTARVVEYIKTTRVVDAKGSVTSEAVEPQPQTIYRYVVGLLRGRWYLVSTRVENGGH